MPCDAVVTESVLSSRRKAALVLGCGAGMYFSVGILLIYGFSVFIKPIADETGWSRSAVAAAVAPVALISGLMSPLAGALADRFGPRLVLLVSSVTMGAGIVGIAVLPRDLSSFLLAFTVASILGGAQTGVPYTHVIVGWFDARRGLALGCMLSFVGLGVATVPPILSILIAGWGWRTALAIAGMASVAVLLPVALFIIRDPPRRGSGPSAALRGATFDEAVATPAFWVMLIAFLLNSAVAAGGSVSLPLILADRGAAPEIAASAMSVVGAALVAARLGFGALLDRISPIPLTCVAFCAPVLGHLVLAATNGASPAFISAALFGLASGAEGDAIGYLLARRFGLRSFGKLYGLNYFAFSLGAGVGPLSLIWLAGGGADYTTAFVAGAAVGCLAPALMLSQCRLAGDRAAEAALGHSGEQRSGRRKA